MFHIIDDLWGLVDEKNPLGKNIFLEPKCILRITLVDSNSKIQRYKSLKINTKALENLLYRSMLEFADNNLIRFF